MKSWLHPREGAPECITGGLGAAVEEDGSAQHVTGLWEHVTVLSCSGRKAD